MKKWVKLEVDIPEKDFIMEVRVEHKELCVVRNEGNLYAVENTCPHAGGILSDGWCSQGNVICPVHRYQYNLKTGRGAEGQGDYIYTYPVEQRQDGVYVQIKPSWWRRLFSRKG
jgi:3-phenylpropionate/trans-cinnamate dioxygenase ferredoxin subunit